MRAAGDFENIFFYENGFYLLNKRRRKATVVGVVFESSSVKTRARAGSNYRVATRGVLYKKFFRLHTPDTGSYKYSSFAGGQKFADGDVSIRANRKSRVICCPTFSGAARNFLYNTA